MSSRMAPGLDIPNYYITISNNTVMYNYRGLWVLDTHNSEIKDNIICFNNYSGISVDDSTKILISNNNVSSNGHVEDWCGITLAATSYCDVSENIVDNNGETGISLTSCDHNNVTNNIVDHNGDEGISLTGSDYNNITDNTIRNNDATGIDLEASDYNRIIGNILRGNRKCIEVDENCIGNIIENNDCGKKGIPGFNIYLVSGLFGVILIVLIRRIFKKRD